MKTMDIKHTTKVKLVKFYEDRLKEAVTLDEDRLYQIADLNKALIDARGAYSRVYDKLINWQSGAMVSVILNLILLAVIAFI